MAETIIVALVTGSFALLGVIITVGHARRESTRQHEALLARVSSSHTDLCERVENMDESNTEVHNQLIRAVGRLEGALNIRHYGEGETL